MNTIHVPEQSEKQTFLLLLTVRNTPYFFQNVPNVFRNAPNGLGMGKKLDFIGVGC